MIRLSCLVAVLLATVHAAPATTTPPPCGPYLGRPAPGDTPQLFAPGWVNHGPRTRDIAMTPDGREIYFGLVVGGARLSTIAMTRRGDDGCWSEPEIPALFGDPRWHDLEPHVTPDGRSLLFVSDRPLSGEDGPAVEENIWQARRDADGWAAPQPLPAVINTDAPEFFPSTTRSGALYFTRRDAETRHEVIMRAQPDGRGGWLEPVVLPDAVNAAQTQFNAFVDPDERYLIVCYAGHSGNLGQVDYWIVFRGEDDTWRGPVNLGSRINGPGREGWSPYVSPDGRRFFFMTTRTSSQPAGPRTLANMLEFHAAPGNGLGHVWWIDAAFLEALDPAAD